MTLELELIRTKLSVFYLAKNVELADAEQLLRSLRETVAFLERRIAREKVIVAKESQSVVNIGTQ